VTTHVQVDDDAVIVRFSGIHAVLAIKVLQRVAIEDVEGARLGSARELRKELGVRVGGGYWPGWLCTGHFTWKGRQGLRQLWSVYRDDEVLVIDTKLQRPARIVLQHPDRERLAWLINERVSRVH